jgi:tetratricopeptide (TPR) repeat protein
MENIEEILIQLNNLNLQVVQLCEQGNLESALNIAKQAVNIADTLQQEHEIIADSLNNLAELYRIQGQYIEAELLYVKTLNMRKSLFGESHPDIAQSLNNLASFYYHQGQYTRRAKISRSLKNLESPLRRITSGNSNSFM